MGYRKLLMKIYTEATYLNVNKDLIYLWFKVTFKDIKENVIWNYISIDQNCDNYWNGAYSFDIDDLVQL